MTEAEMQERRAAKQAEQPMASSLKAMALEAAARDREQKALAQKTILCACKCPPKDPCRCGCRNHPHTLAEAYAEATRMDYGFRLRRAQEQVAVDLPLMLSRSGCPELHINRIRQGGLDERPSLFAAKVWLGIEPERLGVQGAHAKLIVKAQQTRQHRRPFLGLFGNTDRGKTLAAIFAMFTMMKRYQWGGQATGQNTRPFAFVRMSEFAATLAWTPETEAWLARLKSASMLILDDMGKEHLSPVARMMLFDLLDTRYGRGLSTVITSQIPVKEFQLRYDGPISENGSPGAIYRRLRERGLILRDAGEDLGAIFMSGDSDVKRWAARKDPTK